MSQVYVIMGVSGSGKSTVGLALAEKLGIPFYDGDDFHPPANVVKMANGIPLTDEDRTPWLARLHDLIADHLARDTGAVVACSALKRKYRDQLREGNPGVIFVHLHGTFEVILARMQARPGHYMKAGMLQSQFDTLELPSSEEALTFDIEEPVANIVNGVIARSG